MFNVAVHKITYHFIIPLGKEADWDDLALNSDCSLVVVVFISSGCYAVNKMCKISYSGRYAVSV